MDPQIEILGVVVRQPWSVITNLLLAAECIVLGVITARENVPQPRLRAWFFFALGVGAFFGAPKHGFPDVPWHAAIRFGSNVGLGVAVTFAQLAAIRTRVPSPSMRRLLERLVLLQMTAFVALSFFTQDFIVPGVNLAVGMTPVLIAAAWAGLRGCPASLWIALGLVVSLGAGAVYALGTGLNPWFNHIDVAHVLLMMTVAFVFRGIHRPWRAGFPGTS
jgi:hypothetical protein